MGNVKPWERVANQMDRQADVLELEVRTLGPRDPKGHQIDVEEMAEEARIWRGAAEWIRSHLWDPPATEQP